jgi:hypothetical protein
MLGYELDGCRLIYTPDALVERDGHLEFLEFKYEVDAATRERKWRAIGGTLSAGGHAFRVITERHLRREPHHGNVREVFRHRHSRPDRSLAELALRPVLGSDTNHMERPRSHRPVAEASLIPMRTKIDIQASARQPSPEVGHRVAAFQDSTEGAWDLWHS